MNEPNNHDQSPSRSNFVRDIIVTDQAQGYQDIVTRFPPEPNGYLHIGHAKAIWVDFGLAQEFAGNCNLRFDDTNPTKEDVEYADAIQADIRWLGYSWSQLCHASDYFETLYQWAELLVERGLAYVDSQNEEEIRATRGTVTEPGTASPNRDRSVEENLDLFREMRAGAFPDGAHVLRAKIDMGHANMKMRDPLMYRIRHAHHWRTGNDWCIYPFYDWAHGQSDAIEGVTHSICTLEFENNRELYDWFLEAIGNDTLGVTHAPKQIEFARLNLSHTMMSKRKLLQLVEGSHVAGWDDPRMPTIAGLRRRGVTPEAIRTFCIDMGVAKTNSVVDMARFEYAIRDDLNNRAPRVMAVLDPLKVVITTLENEVTVDAPLWPHDIAERNDSRPLVLERELYIDRSDFKEEPPKGFHRLLPGGEVRLRHSYVIRCDAVIHDQDGNVTELRCSHDADTLGKRPEGRKVKGTIQWVGASHHKPIEARIYDRLFSHPAPLEAEDFLSTLNPDSLVQKSEALVEAWVGTEDALALGEGRYQFERLGYFAADATLEGTYNRIVALKDSWKPIEAAEENKAERAPSAAKSDKGSESKSDHKRDRRSAREARDQVRASNGALAERFNLFVEKHGLDEDAADFLTGDEATAHFFETAIDAGGQSDTVARTMRNVLAGLLGNRRMDELPFDGAALATLLELQENGAITGRAAKQVLEVMVERGGTPQTIIDELGLAAMDDSEALRSMVQTVIEANPDAVARLRAGETKLKGFFVGQVMKSSQGRADPAQVGQLLDQLLA